MLTINSEKNTQDFKSRNIILSSYIIFFMLCDLGIIKANLYPTVENDIVVYKYFPAINYFFIGLNLTDFILSYFLLKWKKWAFWLLTLTSLASICWSIFLDESLFPLIGFLYIVVLYVLLQLKKNNVSGWSKLK